ncbi:unnamed protein product [Urochloa humidicola]
MEYTCEMRVRSIRRNSRDGASSRVRVSRYPLPSFFSLHRIPHQKKKKTQIASRSSPTDAAVPLPPTPPGRLLRRWLVASSGRPAAPRSLLRPSSGPARHPRARRIQGLLHSFAPVAGRNSGRHDLD